MQLITHIPLLLALSASLCYASSSTYDGKPGCKTPGEIGNLYRNFWDPMRYWRCIGLDMEPLRESCPDVTAFQQSLGRCVPWRYWKWEVPVYPPSCPTGVMCIQTEPQPSSLYLQELYPQQTPQALSPISPLYPRGPQQTLVPTSSLYPYAAPQAFIPTSPLYPQALPQALVSTSPLYPQALPQGQASISHQYPQAAPQTLVSHLYPQASPQSLVPTSSFAQPQVSTKPQFIGPLTPQPSPSPQNVHSPQPSQPFVSPQSPLVWSSPHLSPQSQQVLNTPYPMISSRPQYPVGHNV
ncbi:tyrosine-protein phosphatase non-receptor type 23-like [Bactrocera tryoni]|uniref:tyrosine-protein phosphatase non-receptor type 23-like n=1 Tax=Bactrocera tryoni TaxID=59916 RepID=UPI001A96E46C|nr:tyrosine-protein phosphatase non-receptor type 23-like [Bactrocera tryoni]